MCSLLHVHDVLEDSGARYLVTVINEQMMLATPHLLDPGNHLKIACNDIVAPRKGLVEPTRFHIDDLLAFTARWNRQGPLVVHCWAGISRSTAAAFIMACALNPDASEAEIASRLRTASPTASPNRLLVELGDDALQRKGRMLTAIDEMDAYVPATDVAQPFRLPSRFD